ncbi:MAG: hypothetical protein II369_03345, partial [Clostridia bacterium]|nr:hypothetical protein [Clostridia bacterium]
WIVILVGVIYIIFRAIGKYAGSYFSAKAVHCAPSIGRYLGVTLLPQAGVAIGMSITAATMLESGSTVRSIVLFAVMIYELVGPMLTKIALVRAGDITPKDAPDHHLTIAEAFADEPDEEDQEKSQS